MSSFAAVLVDPLETPDTVPAPLPYPVLLMDATLRRAFAYEGFPATYFVRPSGTFTTTLLGYHPLDQLAAMTARLLAADAPVNSPAVAPQDSSARQPWDAQPWLAFVPRAWKQWHPLVIHFPVVLLLVELLLVELVLVAACRARPAPDLERLSFAAFALAVLSFVPTIFSGLNDVGSTLGPGWAVWNGLRDRLGHFWMLRSSVSLHVMLASALVLVSLLRFGWRIRVRDAALRGTQGRAFLAATVLGVWLLLGAGQVGGALSHA